MNFLDIILTDQLLKGIMILIATGCGVVIAFSPPVRKRIYLWEEKRKAKVAQVAAVTEAKKDELPSKIGYQIFGRMDTTDAIIKKGSMSRGTKMKHYKKRSYFPDHYLKQEVKDVFGRKKFRYFVRWNIYWSEAMENMTALKPKYSETLESLLANDMVLQLKDAAGALATLLLDRNTQLILLIAFAVASPIGLGLNDIVHWVPTTIVHWLPTK